MKTQNEIKEALKKAMHPEMNVSLPDMAMIREVKDKTVTLVVPFLHVPILNDLIKIIKETIKKEVGIEAEVLVKEMNQEEKKHFGDTVKKIRSSNT